MERSPSLYPGLFPGRLELGGQTGTRGADWDQGTWEGPTPVGTPILLLAGTSGVTADDK